MGELELVSAGATIVGTNSQNVGGAQGPEKLFDGNKTDPDTGKWCEDEGDEKLWVAFDIGDARNVKQLVVSHAGVGEDAAQGSGSTNTANYEFYVLDEGKVNVDELLAMEPEARNEVLANNDNWKQIAKTSDNAQDVTTNTFDETGRIFKFNVSRTDTTGWKACVRIYELELYAAAEGGEPEPTPVDKEALNALIAAAAELTETNYTTASWAPFAEALANAQTVSANESATQDDVNNAAAALQAAQTALVERADNTELVNIIAEAANYAEEDYLPESWADFAQALAEAQAVADNRDATPEEIDAAAVKLAEAILALEARADMTNLNEAIAAADALDANAYTAESWKAIAEKLEIAKAVAADTNATQDAVNAATLELQTALAALEEAGDTTALSEAIAEAKALDLSQYTQRERLRHPPGCF